MVTLRFGYSGPQVSASHGERNERQSEQRADEQDQAIPKLIREIHRHDNINDQEFDGVVVERGLKLRRDQAPEAALPAASGVVQGGLFALFHEGEEK